MVSGAAPLHGQVGGFCQVHGPLLCSGALRGPGCFSSLKVNYVYKSRIKLCIQVINKTIWSRTPPEIDLKWEHVFDTSLPPPTPLNCVWIVCRQQTQISQDAEGKWLLKSSRSGTRKLHDKMSRKTWSAVIPCDCGTSFSFLVTKFTPLWIVRA